ncbi:MAG: tRNA preQ1(34) S-adenosylmethionine ribosyltransferase-isomerase QueA [Burkholderiaceae bacterium]|nr:tRNA preQ1(34) S-adenosylmethionine ribosyltransferase-isomerase QueA [Burkholderiaceae bacterium]
MTPTILHGPDPLLEDFDFELPESLIAQHPAPARTASRLLRVENPNETIADPRLRDLRFSELPELLRAGDLLVVNDTRVIAARLIGAKDSGGRVEALLERVCGEREALAMLRASKAPRIGTRLRFAAGTTPAGAMSSGAMSSGAMSSSAMSSSAMSPDDSGSEAPVPHGATVVAREGEFYRLRFDENVSAVLACAGRLPLPPYIRHRPHEADRERYQTVYARAPGSVAAPTAGLHFDHALLDRLAAKGIETARLTLHVGAGTFQPVRSERISQHRMHSERFVVPQATADTIAAARARGGRIVAVGTTSLRTLESAADENGVVHAQSGETALFVTPGYRFRVVERLITNFHLPRSTLLMLVCAFAGTQTIRAAYAHAIARRYRFFSYGDAMLLDRER